MVTDIVNILPLGNSSRLCCLLKSPARILCGKFETAQLANHKRLYHLGMEAVAKSTLSEAMNRRNPEIFKELFEEILDRVMAVAPKHKFKFKNPLYAIDSTTIDLCLSRYNWAYYRKHKGAIKLHT